MRIKNQQDFWSGIMFVVLGAGFALGATQYSMGTAARMGPGYFPFWLGILLAVLGLIITFGALSEKTEETQLEKFDWMISLIVIGSVALTGIILDYVGVYISVFLLVVLSSLASYEHSWKVSIISGLFMVIFVWLAFIKGLGLIFPLWPSFIGN
ncbi:tripartite tricarboxylate transporter TctB family protein [Allopusillimonas soli]|uniref:Tripartite tricarboxylate transporter TctB family protein n=1 Tax=Allopusillimonas soli TaxID=659016 RepID=A0A853FG22_9BURK|nr:tripartite tricarboxylate transporter TctB family protein [Allopusillimonas soli]NYT37750.1 tripartite tricarboxylate transporter TctB family protein [Allopusillimonas soli]TEA74310.1 tripartite tricarboxylate transporter TctB family protein [Allopusillimonas soli]